MRCTGRHVQPRAGGQIELVTVHGEPQPPREDLDHGASGRLMLGEPFTGVEAEDGDLQALTPVDDLGHDSAGLDGDVVRGSADQRVGHTSIMLRFVQCCFRAGLRPVDQSEGRLAETVRSDNRGRRLTDSAWVIEGVSTDDRRAIVRTAPGVQRIWRTRPPSPQALSAVSASSS